MKVKKKKPEWYSIFIVPEGRPAARQLRVPHWAFKALCVAAVAWLGATFIIATAAVYYRDGWRSTADLRRQNEEMKAETAKVAEKLSNMEQVLNRAQRLASSLETAVGINKKAMQKGIGPVADDDDLPDIKKLASFKKYELSSRPGEDGVGFNDLELKMDEVDDTIASVEMRLQQVYEFHQDKLAYWASVPSIWPVRGWVTSDFGIRRAPRIGTRFHEGIDIAAPTGTPVYASGDGVVTFAGYKHGLGKTVVIDHGFGVTTIYGHNSRLYVQEGQRIKRGMNIANVGCTGRSTGPHLHYQVEVDSVPVDPMRYIIENF